MRGLKYKKIIILASLLLVAYGLSTYALTSCVSEVHGFCVVLEPHEKSLAEKITLSPLLAQTSIPGLEFLSIPADADIGDILVSIYVFVMFFVGLSALIIIVFAGVWYISAGDNQNRVGQAKTWMKNAVFGLVLALLSWLILYTINQDLVLALSINLPKLETAGSFATGDFCSTANCAGLCDEINDVCVPSGTQYHCIVSGGSCIETLSENCTTTCTAQGATCVAGPCP